MFKQDIWVALISEENFGLIEKLHRAEKREERLEFLCLTKKLNW